MFVSKPGVLVALALTLVGLGGCERSADTACVPEAPAGARQLTAPPSDPAAAAAATATPSPAVPGPASPAAAAAPIVAPAGPAAAQPASLATSLRVKRLVLSEGVASREPIGSRRVFRDGDNDKVFAFVEVENPERLPGEIVVSFEPPDGPEIGNVRLSVGATPRWRTWAFSRSVKELGEWTAVVRDGEGRVLAREPFSVTL